MDKEFVRGVKIVDSMIVEISNDTFMNFMQQYAETNAPINDKFNLEISKYKEDYFQVKFIDKHKECLKSIEAKLVYYCK